MISQLILFVGRALREPAVHNTAAVASLTAAAAGLHAVGVSAERDPDMLAEGLCDPQLWTALAVAALFGFVYAGTMPLYAAIARENFPLKMMGTVIGGTAMAGSLGMATGPVAGGLIYDTFASYTWLYVGSWAMGLGAFLIAMTFRPFPKVKVAAVPATA